MADDHRTLGQPGDVALQAGEAVEVEVVRRLVEEEQVEARQQQRGQPDPGGLAAGEAAHRLAEQRRTETEVGPHVGEARLEVGRAERQPALQRRGVLVVGAGGAGGQPVGRGVQAAVGRVHAGAPGEVVGDGLVGAFGLLVEQPDVRPDRGEAHRAALGAQLTGEDAQQGALADAVRPDEADAMAGIDGDVHAVEDDAGTE